MISELKTLFDKVSLINDSLFISNICSAVYTAQCNVSQHMVMQKKLNIDLKKYKNNTKTSTMSSPRTQLDGVGWVATFLDAVASQYSGLKVSQSAINVNFR